MGNLATILSAPIFDDESEVSIGKIDDAKIQTPARFRNCEIRHTHSVDPRSPTVDIDRTPILLEKPPLETLMNTEDPRSPTFGITRTPVAVGLTLPPKPIDWNDADVTINEEINKEKEQLMQVLDFTDLESVSSIHPEDSSVVEDAIVADQALPTEEPLEFSCSSFTSSTPAPSPIKSMPSKVKHIIDKENSVVKNQSPSSLTTSRRVPFGDVNRSATSSPRLQLQNRQKLSVRNVIQGNSLKID